MNIISALSIYGYVELFDIQSVEEALGATSPLGDVIPLNDQVIQTLTPTNSEAAASPSFSKRYGRAAFPLHTDTAFWEKPARFVVFFMTGASRTATLVLPLQDAEVMINFAKSTNPIFLRQTVNGPIYSRPWAEKIGGCALYDPCYMRPANHAAKDFETVMAKISARAHSVAWTGKKVLIIDNWRTFHGREDCSNDKRVLFRFYRGEANELAS
ncbi:MAG: hypothetical protein ACTHJG_10720 [Rhodanobacteraceae bacterium]